MFESYFISDFFEGAPKPTHFHINRLEDMPPLPQRIKSPHKHRFYEVILMRSGKMLQNVDYDEYTVTGRNLFFISQGQLHFWSKTEKENFSGYRLMFTEDFFQIGQADNQFLFELIYLDNVYQTPLLTIPESSKQIFEYFYLMHQEFNRTDCNEQALRALLFLVLSETQRLANANRDSPTSKAQVLIFKQFVQLMELHFTDKWSVEQYAHVLHTTPRQLNRVLREVANQNFSSMLQNRICLEAKRLLNLTGLTVNQISEHLGFEDPAYFSRFFRKNTELSPLDFRRQGVK
jgi:AraC-like DNA-binding protein